MTGFGKYLAAALVAGGLAAPIAAQAPYPYPQPYPPGYTYPGQPYGYQQGYGNQGAIGQIIDQLLGNRYNVTDRAAVSRCASAAVNEAARRYTPYGYNQGYNQGYGGPGYPGQGYGAANIRVAAITNVERRSNGLRVYGLLDSGMYRGYGQQGYGGQYGYQNQGYAAGDLTFRCNVDYRGYVTNVRINRNSAYRRY